jgi:hypothetical protein
MPSLTSNTAMFRRGGFNFTGYVSVLPQTVVLAGTVSATPTLPTLTIAYTLTSGDEADVLTGMTVHLFSSTGVRKGTLRVATGGTITSVSLPINEVSQGAANIVSGDTFQVVDEWRIWDKLVSATAALNKDSRIAYSDQGSNPNPVCNSGGAYAGFNATVSFAGGTSFVVDPDSSAITHSWDFVDGTPDTSTSAAPSSVFPAGFRWVSHTITDVTNSKTSTQRIPVWVHDSTYAPLAVQVDNMSASVDQGWRCTFKLPAGTEGSITNLPDGALVVYHEREYYNGTEANYGSLVTGRSNVKFIGYLVSDSINITPDENTVTFEAVSPLAILDQTPALPQLMVNKASPARWSELKTLTTKKMFWYLANWGSNLLDAWDFVWNDGLDLGYTRLSVDGDSIGAQLRDIANSLNVQLTCDRLGRILFTRDPDFLTTGERTSRTKTYDLTTADVMTVDVTRNHRGTVKSVRGEGITPANKAVFSNGGGNAPAPFGTGSETLSKQIVATQASLNERAGYYFAKVNGLYNGQFVPRGARITLPDGYDVFDPAYREFVTLTLASSLNTRAVGWDNTTKWTVENVEVSYDTEAGAKTVNLTLNHETSGAAGTTYVPPPESSNAIPTFPPIDIQFPDLPIDLGVSIDGVIVIPPGTTSGGYVAVWSEDTSWLVENALTLAEPPYGDNTP